MDSGPSVFLTGVTGYLGGSVLTQLLQLDYPPASITCLLRDVSKAAAIEALSTPRTKVITFRGSLEAHDLLAVQVAQHDVVIETASSDDLEGIGAMLQGMRRGGRHPVFIHTSGTGTLVDDARGMFKGHTVYTDQVVDPPEGFKPIDALPDDAFHRPIDLACVQADLNGWCDTYIVLPGTIWGTPQGEIYEKGLANSHSIQVPQMIKSGLDRGQVGYMGKGENSWVHVNIIDCAELYALLYTKVVTFKEKLGHGKDGYYFAVAGEYVRIEVARSIATALSSHGWITPDLKPFSEEEIDKYFGGKPGGKYYMGTNSRAFPHKAQQLGWKAERSTTRAFYKDCEHEAVRIASEQK